MHNDDLFILVLLVKINGCFYHHFFMVPVMAAWMNDTAADYDADQAN